MGSERAQPEGAVLGDRIYSAVKTVAIGTVKGTTVAIADSDDTAIRLWDLTIGRAYGTGLTGPEKGAESIAIGNLGTHVLPLSFPTYSKRRSGQLPGSPPPRCTWTTSTLLATLSLRADGSKTPPRSGSGATASA